MFRNITVKQIFLIDSLGAVLTAVLLSQVLVRLVPFFGMPESILYLLAGIAACFALYSFTCYLLVKDNWRPFLLGIAIANTLYCMVTFSLVVYLFNSMTALGIAYFIGEIILVLGLVALELKIYARSSKERK